MLYEEFRQALKNPDQLDDFFSERLMHDVIYSDQMGLETPFTVKYYGNEEYTLAPSQVDFTEIELTGYRVESKGWGAFDIRVAADMMALLPDSTALHGEGMNLIDTHVSYRLNATLSTEAHIGTAHIMLIENERYD